MFKVGQQVVCITREWWLGGTDIKMKGPKFNEVCTIVGLMDGYLLIAGYVGFGAYSPSCFRPIDMLMDQLERIEQESAPVAEPEPAHA